MFRRSMSAVAVALALVLTASAAFAAEPPKSMLPISSPDTIVLIRVKNIDQAVKSLVALVGAFDANAGPAIAMQIDKTLAELPGIDRNGPAALLLLDPKKFPDNPLVGIFMLKDADAFKAGAKGDDKVQVIGKFGLGAQNADALAQVAAEITRTGLNAIPVDDFADMIAITADAGAILTRYKNDVQAEIELARVNLGANPANPGAPPDPNKRIALRLLDYAQLLLAEAEKQLGPVQLGISFDSLKISGQLSAEFAPASPVASFLARNKKPVNPTVANFLPKGPFAAGTFAFDPKSVGELYAGLARFGTDILGTPPDEAAALSKLAIQLTGNLSGFGANAALIGKTGQDTVKVIGITDKDAARDSFRACFTLAQAGTIGDAVKRFGITLSLKENARQSNGIPVDRAEVSFDLDKTVAALGVPPEQKPFVRQALAQALKNATGSTDKMITELAYGKNLLVAVQGPDAEALMDQQIALVRSNGADGFGTTPEYKTAIANQPKDASVLGTLSFFGYTEVIAQMLAQNVGPFAAMFPARAELPQQEALMSFSVRFDGDKALFAFHVPVKPISDFVAVIRQKFEKMRQQMMPPPMPGPGPAPEIPPDEEE